mmetsp:Transcript_27990/g.64525  ORF Transcript_27990/g.64525 Transcript_27990/m.64525 type:complete len:253 (-) Transcript_27990:161-919(-)
MSPRRTRCLRWRTSKSGPRSCHLRRRPVSFCSFCCSRFSFSHVSLRVPTEFVDNVWVYNGKEVENRKNEPFICRLIKRHHYQTKLHEFFSFEDSPLRSVLWTQYYHVVVFPTLVAYPDISKVGKTDLRAYVAAGNNMVFMGGYLSLQVMNDIFGFSLRDDFKEGPYYRNDRNVRDTPFQFLPSRINEPSPRVFGAMSRSLPPGGRSLYDSLGCSVVFYISYDLGTIVYVGFQYDTPFTIDRWVRVLHAAIDM